MRAYSEPPPPYPHRCDKDPFVTAAVVEVKYLYAFLGGSLFQPVCLGEREDTELTACVIGQLKYKASGEDEEAESAVGGELT